MELIGNKAIENAAIEFVIDYERQAGREARDRRYKGVLVDIESDGRMIEVKAVGASQRGWFLPVETRQRDLALTNDAFYLYVVENVRQGVRKAFTLRILDAAHVRRLLANAKRREYYEMPWPVADYDATPVERS